MPTRKWLCAALAVGCLVFHATTLHADADATKTQTVEVKASDTAQLQALLEKQKVDIRFTDGTLLRGQVREVKEGTILIKVARAAGPNALTKGDHSIATSGLATIKLTKYRGKQRALLATALGFAGLGLTVLIVATADDSSNVSYGAVAAAAIAGGAVGGYAWGRSRDKQEVTVVIR